MIWIFIFVVALIVLIKSSDYFTKSSESLGIHLGLSSFVVGVVIVGFGTSLPELISSIISVTRNSSEIVIGNVLGSNITNILLVLGVSSLFAKKFNIEKAAMKMDLTLMVGSAIMLAFMIRDLKFSLAEAVIFLLTLVLYLSYSIYSGRGGINEDELESINKESILKPILGVVISGVFVFLGAKYTIEAVIQISKTLNIAPDVIALSAVAIGTSLPEVMVGISAARRGNSGMIVGNIMGSNIFNCFAVMGVARLFGDLVIPPDILNFSVPVSITVCFFYVLLIQDKNISRFEGGFLLIFYGYFLGEVFGIY